MQWWRGELVSPSAHGGDVSFMSIGITAIGTIAPGLLWARWGNV